MSKRTERQLAKHLAAARKQKTKPDPWELITYKGWKMSRYTAAAIAVLEAKLGFVINLTQGPYNKGSVGASAGTHDLDGVIDLSPYRWRKKVKVARSNSWAMWPRPTLKGVWSKHCHGVLKRAKPMAALAVSQLEVSYPARRDGLAGNGVDGFPYHPILETFDYNEWWHDELLTQQIDGLSAKINGWLDKVSTARAVRKRLREQRRKAS